MKFTVSSTSLLSHLQLIGRVISSKNTLPILECFLFELKDNHLYITAADLETRMQTSLPLTSSEGKGLIAISARNLLDSLKELPDQPINFEVNDTNYAVVVHYQNGQFNFVGQNGNEYPEQSAIADDTLSLTLPTQIMLAGINRTFFAIANDELRPVMNGIFLDISDEDLTFVASDGHKLVRFKTTDVKGNQRSSFILPQKPASVLKNVLTRDSGDIKINFDEKQAHFSLDNFQLTCRLIEGRFPNYNAVIPQANPYKVIIDRQQFLNTLKRVSVFSNVASSLVKLQINENSILVSAQDLDYSISAQESIACNYSGESMNIGFKAIYFIEILSSIPTENVQIELADPSRASLILPSEEAEEKEDLLMLLMPMMLSE